LPSATVACGWGCLGCSGYFKKCNINFSSYTRGTLNFIPKQLNALRLIVSFTRKQLFGYYDFIGFFSTHVFNAYSSDSHLLNQLGQHLFLMSSPRVIV